MKQVCSILLSMLCAASYADAYAADRWVVDRSMTNLKIAKVSNQSNSTTGVVCSTVKDKCLAYIASDVDCEEGHEAPVLTNSPLGAHLSTVECNTFEGRKYLILSDFDSAVKAFETEGQIGYAIPMKSGEFRVMRFSGTNATRAIREARTPVNRDEYL